MRGLAAVARARVEDALARRRAAQLDDDLRARVGDREQAVAPGLRRGRRVEPPRVERVGRDLRRRQRGARPAPRPAAAASSSRVMRPVFARSVTGGVLGDAGRERERLGGGQLGEQQRPPARRAARRRRPGSRPDRRRRRAAAARPGAPAAAAARSRSRRRRVPRSACTRRPRRRPPRRPARDRGTGSGTRPRAARSARAGPAGRGRCVASALSARSRRAAPAQHAVDQLGREPAILGATARARDPAPPTARGWRRRRRPRRARARRARATGRSAPARPARAGGASARLAAALPGGGPLRAAHARTVPAGIRVAGEHRRGRQAPPPGQLQLAERDRAARRRRRPAPRAAGPAPRRAAPAARAATTRGANSFSGAPSSIALAPGHGSTPRACAETTRAGRSNVRWPSAFVSSGASVAAASSCGASVTRPSAIAGSVSASSRGAQRGQLLGQRPRRVVVGDRQRAHRRHRPGVEPRLHAHDRDAGLAVAADDRPLDRRGAAQLRQQRRVHVVGPEPRQIEQALRQDAPVGDDDEEVGGERRQRRLGLGRAHLLGLDDRHAQRAPRRP